MVEKINGFRGSYFLYQKNSKSKIGLVLFLHFRFCCYIGFSSVKGFIISTIFYYYIYLDFMKNAFIAVCVCENLLEIITILVE